MSAMASSAQITRPICKHPYDPHDHATSRVHTAPVACGHDCCTQQPRCLTCRESFCICATF